MQLGIQNFTSAGNELMYRKDWERFQRERCESKTMVKMENKLHYDRILNGLTDNRSIDILNDDSLKNVKKMDTREYIIRYIEACNGKKSIKEMAEGIAIALDIPVEDTAKFRSIYNTIMEELKAKPPVLAEVSVAIDGRTVAVRASEAGVVAGDNIFSIDGIPSQQVDEETGELAMTYWVGDNQVPERRGMSMDSRRLISFMGNSGDRITEVPGQFSLPMRLPPQTLPIRFNRSALPDTTELPFQVDPSMMIDDSRPPRALPAPEAHNGLNELFVPRTTYIRTFATESTEPSTVVINEIGSTTGTQTYGLYNPNELYSQDVFRFAEGLRDVPRRSNVMGTQTEGDYPPSPLTMTPRNVLNNTTGKRMGRGNVITQTAQTGPEGMIATSAMRGTLRTSRRVNAEEVASALEGLRVMNPLELGFGNMPIN